MYFVELTVLLFCFYNIAALRLHGVRFRQNINNTVPLPGSIEQKWIQQPLDHFDDSQQSMWNMKYFQNMEFWQPNGPIYLFINGEAPAKEAFMQTGYLYELASETNGAMFLSEHRYYGDSKPVDSFTPESLQYLSSKQALADNAKLLMDIKSNPQLQSSKVVVIGGSYAGNLAAWMKVFYPNLVDAAIASSAPVLAKVDFFEYIETVGLNFKKYGTPGCYDKISQMFERYEELLKTDYGINTLKEEEQICESSDLRKRENQQLFYFIKLNSFMSVSQYGSLAKIQQLCDSLDSSSVLLSREEDELTVWNEKLGCHSVQFDSYVESLRTYEMSWFYQTCTEFGYFQTCKTQQARPFSCNIAKDFYINACQSLYGPDFGEERVNAGVQQSNELYGGLEPKVSNVVFTNGELDPWHNLGVLNDLSSDAPAKRIAYSSHCADMSSDMPDDPEELKQARRYVKNLIKEWIGAY